MHGSGSITEYDLASYSPLFLFGLLRSHHQEIMLLMLLFNSRIRTQSWSVLRSFLAEIYAPRAICIDSALLLAQHSDTDVLPLIRRPQRQLPWKSWIRA